MSRRVSHGATYPRLWARRGCGYGSAHPGFLIFIFRIAILVFTLVSTHPLPILVLWSPLFKVGFHQVFRWFRAHAWCFFSAIAFLAVSCPHGRVHVICCHVFDPEQHSTVLEAKWIAPAGSTPMSPIFGRTPMKLGIRDFPDSWSIKISDN